MQFCTVFTNVSEKLAASIFRDEVTNKTEGVITLKIEPRKYNVCISEF